jgi:dihydroorotase
MRDYDTNLKVNPPLRTKEDRDAVQKAISDGTIDCIATHHLPHEFDSKVLEFEYAKYGMIGLETAYAVLHTAMPSVPNEKWIELLSINPRRLFGLEQAIIKKGNKAILTLFDPVKKWNYEEKNIVSKSKNSPFIGKELSGKPLGIVNHTKTAIL